MNRERKAMSQLKAVFFDMDGLLVNSEIHYLQGWQAAFGHQGIEVPYSTLLTWRGKSTVGKNEELIHLSGGKSQALNIREHREQYLLQILADNQIQLKKGAKELLDYLANQHLYLGLASSSPNDRGTKFLEAFNLHNYFNQVLFANDVDHTKPDPEMYLKHLKFAGCQADEAMVIEDSRSGLLAANRAQISHIMVPDDEFEDDIFIEDLNHLIMKADDLLEVKDYLRREYF